MPVNNESKITNQEEIQLVSFTLGKETFGVAVGQVRSIGKVEEITKVPKMPSYVEGVMNLRGQITTVIDLRKRFRISDARKNEDQARIIVAELEETQLGIIVDSVQDVIRVPAGTVSEPPKMIQTSIDRQYITGIARLKERLVILLDFNRILSMDELDEVIEGVEGVEELSDIETEPVKKKATKKKGPAKKKSPASKKAT